MSDLTISEADVIQFQQAIQDRLRARIREAIEAVLEEELELALGAGRHERSEARRGYRNGCLKRRVTTPDGIQELRVPRGRIFREGAEEEFRSQVLPRYQRRLRRVDEAILGAYLSGANTRRIRKALEPLLGQEHLSRSAVSRVLRRLKGLFEAWRSREVSGERYAVLFLDGLYLRVRLVRRVVSVPVLAVLGVREDGRKVLVALELAASESGESWRGLMEGLIRRGLGAPVVLVTDGHRGLARAREAWPGVRVQRCTQHKWRNLMQHCPRHARRELKRDWDRILYARDGMGAREAYDAFLEKWRKLCPAVARSLEEAGLELLTFYEFPRAMWRGLRSTNTLENLNREFRRRTKTQGSFATEEAAVALLFGLVAFGQIAMRRITGHRHVASLMDEGLEAVA